MKRNTFPLLVTSVLAAAGTFAETVCETGRELPLIEDVDVVVAGGGFSAVASAIAAKEAGASVFLVTPRQDPGEDLIATRRLWVQSGDEGTDDPLVAGAFPTIANLTYSYVPSVAAVSPHQDDKHVVLNDGAFGDVQYQTVQYGDATNPLTSVDLTITPKGDWSMQALTVVYHAATSATGNYGTGEVSVFKDGVAIPSTSSLASNSAYKTLTLTLETPLSGSAGDSFVLRCATAQDCVRQLIGEVTLVPETAIVAEATSPNKVFKALDAALKAADVPYFTGAQVCDVLKDADGRVSGVVIANRSGRQAVRAKVVVDATMWGAVARKAAALRPVAAGNETVFTHVITMSSDVTPTLPAGATAVVKASELKSAALTPSDLKPSNAPASYPLQTLAVSKSYPFTSSDYLSVNAIAQEFRSALWQKSLVDQGDVPFFVPPESIETASRVTSWTSASVLPLAAFKASDELYVASLLADIDRGLAERLSYPGVAATLGRRIGAAAAAAAQTRGQVPAIAGGQSPAAGTTPADIRENNVRPIGIGSVKAGEVSLAAGSIPVLADMDVVVVGGGTAGGPAAIAAAGEGKRVLLAEWIHNLGGTTTESRIGRYWYGNAVGFTKTLDTGVKGTNAKGWVFVQSKAEWLRSQAIEKGATVVFGAFAEGVLVDGQDEAGRDKVRGVVLVLPDGTRGLVRAKAVVDATGNSDIAAAAGAETMFLSPTEFAMQGSAASPHNIGQSYRNSDVGFLNTPDAGDLFTFALRARLGLPDDAWNLSHVNVGARERRRIVGDYIVSARDILCNRTYPDTIMHGYSNFDMHGFTDSELMMYFYHVSEDKFRADLPYRSLLAKSLDGVYTTGLAISAERDAMPILRMQPDVQNEGYAAGLAAAMACDAGSVRAVDVKALQQRLVGDGCLNARVLTDESSGVSSEELAAAISGLDLNFYGLPKILDVPAESLPLVQAAFAAAEAGSAHQQALACALMLLGDESGFDVIADAYRSASVTQGSDFRGLGNFGRQTDAFDIFLYTLAKSRNPQAEAIISRRVGELVASDQARTIRKLSHFRMAARAAEMLKSDRIAAQLTALLARNAVLSNRTKTGAVEGFSYKSENSMDTERTQTLRELAHLRARFRFGDESAEEGLRAYLNDYRTIYATTAQLALDQPRFPAPVGVWLDADTYKIDLGKATAPASLSGTVKLADSTLKVVCGADPSQTSGFVLLPQGGFEPPTALPNNSTSGDRRAKSSKSYFDTNFPSWTFDSTNDGSGIATDGSYFVATWSGTNSIKLRGDPDNAHAAFLFYKDSKHGKFEQTFTVAQDGSVCKLRYDVVSRYFNQWFMGQHSVLLDGQVVETYPEGSGNALKITSWTTREVSLGELSAGEHTIGFMNALDDANNGSLIDNVMLSVTPPSEQSGADFPKGQFSGLSFILNDVTLDFTGTFDLSVGDIHRDGVRVDSLKAGDGCLNCTLPPFIITVR